MRADSHCMNSERGRGRAARLEGSIGRLGVGYDGGGGAGEPPSPAGGADSSPAGSGELAPLFLTGALPSTPQGAVGELLGSWGARFAAGESFLPSLPFFSSFLLPVPSFPSLVVLLAPHSPHLLPSTSIHLLRLTPDSSTAHPCTTPVAWAATHAAHRVPPSPKRACVRHGVVCLFWNVGAGVQQAHIHLASARISFYLPFTLVKVQYRPAIQLVAGI